MSSQKGDTAPSKEVKKSSLKSFLAKLRKRHIIETFAGFIAGGWLFLEFVDRILIAHYHINEKWLDVAFFTLLGALLCVILWRWFSATEKRPGNVKVEVLLVPLIILVILAIDLNLILQIAGIPGRNLLIGIVAFILGVAWIVFKSLQWAAITPELAKKEVEISSSAAMRPEKSIIVLPFINISPEEGQEYFCDGMTEEIITDLSQIHDLLVISRSSAMTLKGSPKTVKEIANELNVRYALEGSVRKAGNDLRITAQLIDGSSDVHLWAEKYIGTLNDVFDIQEKVSHSIVDALRLKLTPEEKRKIVERPISDVFAYESYLKANADILTFAQDKIGRAIQHIQHALEITGDNALLYSGLGFAYWNLVNIGAGQEEYLARAEDCARKALTIDPEFSKGHAVLGWISSLKGGLREAVLHFKRALAKNADESLALIGLASSLQLAGKIPQASALSERLLLIEPLDFPTHWIHGALHFYNGQFNRALELWRRLPELWPENPWSHFSYALALAYNNETDRAFDAIERGARANSEDSGVKLGLMLKYAFQGDKEKARKELTQDFRKTCQRDPQYSHHVASFFSLLDSKDEAMGWLENAVNRGFINYPLLAEKDLFLANMRGEPRFQKLMERVKYEWEHFEV